LESFHVLLESFQKLHRPVKSYCTFWKVSKSYILPHGLQQIGFGKFSKDGSVFACMQRKQKTMANFGKENKSWRVTGSKRV
jgi:hypothetical protein